MSAVKICPAADIAVNQPLKVTIEGVSIAVVKDSAGTVHAIGDVWSN